MHDHVVEHVARHNEVQVVLRRHRVVLDHTLLYILQHRFHVPLLLAVCDAVVADRPQLLHHARQSVAPVPRVGVHGDRGHCAALSERVAVVDLHRRMVGAVPGNNPELHHADEDSRADQVQDVLLSPQGPHWRFRVEVELQALQQLVAEDAQRPVPGLPARGRVEAGGGGEVPSRADHGQAEVVELLRPVARDLAAEQRAGVRRLCAPHRLQDGRVGGRLVPGLRALEDAPDACLHLLYAEVPDHV
mmetsp:Transcript_47037/g.134628  ORF Transcript_47037/g.134628 Transcript_47037/m.134628 type:complete len:246 (-) Transcript_47037:128-865(-)